MRLFAISDLHVDYKENRHWVNALSRKDYTDDLLILAGDISHKSDLICEAFDTISACFKVVIFVPGNHDIWITPATDNGINSIEKFDQVLSLAEKCGIQTNPYITDSLSVIPLYGWYDFSFAPLSTDLKRAWNDFNLCKWPDDMTPEAVTRYFCSLNSDAMGLPEKELTITVSHFLPRIDVMPDYIPVERRFVYPVLGSTQLGQFVNQLKPDIHVYGHSHVNLDVTLDKTRFVNNAYGYPKETRITRKKLIQIA